MSRLVVPLLLASTSMMWTGCSGLAQSAPAEGLPAGIPPSVEAATPASDASAEDLRAALAEAVADPASAAPFHLLVECRPRDGGAMRSLEVFDSGVAIWEGRRQFTLDRNRRAAILATFEEAGFAAFEPVYGGRSTPREEVSEDPPGAAVVTVICRVSLVLGEAGKQSAQLEKGEQFEALRSLAEGLLEICEAPARLGVSAADLAEGLELLARGRLAPETFSLVLHRKPAAGAPGQEAAGGGLLLRIHGTAVTTQPYDPVAGYGEPTVLTLSPAETRRLAGDLAAAAPDDLPANLWARDYTDLTLRVLDHRRSLQARQFAGMTPTSKGEAQSRFDRIVAALENLHTDVLTDGEPHRP